MPKSRKMHQPAQKALQISDDKLSRMKMTNEKVK
jgi:hypothetical protein